MFSDVGDHFRMCGLLQKEERRFSRTLSRTGDVYAPPHWCHPLLSRNEGLKGAPRSFGEHILIRREIFMD